MNANNQSKSAIVQTPSIGSQPITLQSSTLLSCSCIDMQMKHSTWPLQIESGYVPSINLIDIIEVYADYHRHSICDRGQRHSSHPNAILSATDAVERRN